MMKAKDIQKEIIVSFLSEFESEWYREPSLRIEYTQIQNITTKILYFLMPLNFRIIPYMMFIIHAKMQHIWEYYMNQQEPEMKYLIWWRERTFNGL